jgi:hypothetical protein
LEPFRAGAAFFPAALAGDFPGALTASFAEALVSGAVFLAAFWAVCAGERAGARPAVFSGVGGAGALTAFIVPPGGAGFAGRTSAAPAGACS